MIPIARLWLLSAALAAQGASPAPTAEAALARASQRKRYLFLMLYGKQHAAYQKLRAQALAALRGMKREADYAELAAASSEGIEIRKRYGLDQDDLPILVAIAPSRIMTRAFTGVCSPYHLETAMVSPATAAVTQAVREDRTVVLLFARPAFPDRKAVLAAAQAFAAAVPKLPRLVEVDPQDAAEKQLVERCQIARGVDQTHVLIVRHGYLSPALVSPRKAATIEQAYQAVAPDGCICLGQE